MDVSSFGVCFRARELYTHVCNHRRRRAAGGAKNSRAVVFSRVELLRDNPVLIVVVVVFVSSLLFAIIIIVTRRVRARTYRWTAFPNNTISRRRVFVCADDTRLFCRHYHETRRFQSRLYMIIIIIIIIITVRYRRRRTYTRLVVSRWSIRHAAFRLTIYIHIKRSTINKLRSR